jgi:hypothetical protein
VSESEHVKRHWSWQRFQYGLRYALALAGGLTVAGVGDYMSFRNLMRYAERHDFNPGWGLPIGLDAGIPALLLLDSLRPSRFLRMAAWALSAGTVVANAAVTPDQSWIARGLHGIMPALAIIWYEAVRRLNRSAADESKMDKIRLARWLVSPVRTTRLRVRMIRWEVTSYAEALRLESAILLARAVLVAEYGQRVWKRTRPLVPVILAHQLDTGQLPREMFFETDWTVAVRAWVREVLDDLDPHRGGDPIPDDRSGLDPFLVSDVAEPSPWDQVWDQRDRLVPAGVAPEVFAQAIAVTRHHFEQVGRHMNGETLRGLIGGAKARANAMATVIRTAYQSGPDQAVANLDAATPVRAAVAPRAETSPDPAGPSGRTEDEPAPVGGAS